MIPKSVLPAIIAAARAAGHDPAAILAIVEIESGGRVHAIVNSRREPLIRFEGHYFDRRLVGAKRALARRKGLAHPKAGAIANPRSQSARWAVLDRAAAIDAKAAHESCSWGVGQVMGAHWAWLGYGSVDALVAEARSGAAGQVRLMLRYIDKAGLRAAIARRDWTAFARGYNGPAYARHRYHTRIAAAFERYRRMELDGAAPAPDDNDAPRAPARRRLLSFGARGADVAQLQRALTAAGYPIVADGVFGSATRRALRTFQRASRIAADGIAGPQTAAALNRALPLSRAGRTVFAWLGGIWRRLIGAVAP